jgi:hypothetical protein
LSAPQIAAAEAGSIIMTVRVLPRLFPDSGILKVAAEYYRKTAEFVKRSPGFDQDLIDWYSSKATELDASD